MSGIYPPRRGNQIREAGVLDNLGEAWDVESFSLHIQRTDLPWPKRRRRVSDRWTDIRSLDPFTLAWASLLGGAGYPPAYADRLLRLWPHGALVKTMTHADVVMVHPPYQWDWVRRHTPPDVPLVLHEHSIEADMYLPRASRWSRRIATEVARVEEMAVRQADLVLVTSDDDAARVRDMGARATAVVPNGVDVSRFRPTNAAEKDRVRREKDLPRGTPLAVFVGSGHPPNVAAVAALEAMSQDFARVGVTVAVVGRCGLGRLAVDGIRYIGEVDDVAPFLSAADVTLCPLSSGSGTSIKTVEFLASGAPLVTTPIGVRGLGVRPGVEAEVCEIDEMPARVASLLAAPEKMEGMATAARHLTEERFTWAAAGRGAAVSLEKLLSERSPAA